MLSFDVYSTTIVVLHQWELINLDESTDLVEASVIECVCTDFWHARIEGEAVDELQQMYQFRCIL